MCKFHDVTRPNSHCETCLPVVLQGIFRLFTTKPVIPYLRTDHVDYIYKKSNKRLYFIRLLKKSRVECNNIVKIYLVLIRPILEYAVQVWQDIPNFLETKLETIQESTQDYFPASHI